MYGLSDVAMGHFFCAHSMTDIPSAKTAKSSTTPHVAAVHSFRVCHLHSGIGRAVKLWFVLYKIFPLTR